MKRFGLPRFIISLFGLSLGVLTLIVALFYIVVLFRFDGTCVTFTGEPFSCTLARFADYQVGYAFIVGVVLGGPLAMIIALFYTLYFLWQMWRQRHATDDLPLQGTTP